MNVISRKVGRSSANRNWMFEGIGGATTNKSTEGSCLDTDIACRFVSYDRVERKSFIYLLD